jgi:hypothetical protein
MMKGTKFRIAFAAFAVLAVVSATGAAGVASAAPGFPGPRTPGLKPGAQTAQVSTAGTRLPGVKGYVVAGVKVSGNNGPAAGSLNTRAACEADARFINDKIGKGLKELYGGNMEGAAALFGEAAELIKDSEETGCVFA